VKERQARKHFFLKKAAKTFANGAVQRRFKSRQAVGAICKSSLVLSFKKELLPHHSP
jgi:hypothetical protein